MEKRNNLNFSFDDLLLQHNNTNNILLFSVTKDYCIVSVKLSFQDEHIIYKCPNKETYNMLINKLENDYNFDNYIIAIYKHKYTPETVTSITTEIVVPRNTTLLEDDFIGSLDDLPF